MAKIKSGEMPVHLERYIDRHLIFFTLTKVEPRPIVHYKRKNKKHDTATESNSNRVMENV